MSCKCSDAKQSPDYSMSSARGEGANVVSALQRTISLGVDRFNEEKERSPCLGESDNSNRMLGSHRRILLDMLMVCWGLGTWLGVNGLYVQLPLLVQRLPEGWKLPSYMTVAVQLANVGLIAYAVLRRLLPRVPDSIYIYILLLLGTAALYLNSFLYPETIIIGGSERSIALLALMFFAALVGCTSSVLFYPYLRHFRDVYLATYLVGEGLSGFIPSVFALIQGAGGNPECVLSADNKTIETIYPPARFDTTMFLIALGCLATMSLVSFSLIDKLPSFLSERAKPTQVSKDEEASTSESIWEPSWMCVLLLMACLNAFMNGVLPSVQSYSCMPYGINAYHLAVSLGAMANPTACLAGVWLQPVRARSLAAMLCAVLLPLCYILVTAVMSPEPPLHTETSGQILVVAAWVCVSAVMSYARMWVYGWTRRGGAGGMRACGAVTQLGSAVGSLTLWYFINYTTVFKQSAYCRLST